MKIKSIKIKVKKNEVYYWCSCGLSKKQPFCDGSHKKDKKNKKPMKYISNEEKVVSFCSCKKTKKGPICDGSHKKLNI